jgi:hypothetical protein
MRIRWFNVIASLALLLGILPMAVQAAPADASGRSVALALNTPSALGRLVGVVSTLGYCDLNPAALEGATVRIQSRTGVTWTLATNPDGSYSQWIDNAESPVQVTVTLPDYAQAQATDVIIRAGQVTRQDFSVRYLKPCLSVAPRNLSVTLELGQQTTRPLHLINSSGAVATYSMAVQMVGSRSDASWLSETPAADSIPADSATWVTLGFDANKVDVPGRYEATIGVNSDDPQHASIPVTVTMVVTAPADWGLLEGVVQSMGRCDNLPAVLPGATVRMEGSTGITRTVAADKDGKYLVWLPANGSPYNVTISANGHEPQMIGPETIVQQSTAVANVDLRAVLPCVESNADALSVTVPWGGSVARAFTLTNTGAASSLFTITEQAGDFTPVKATTLAAPATGEDILLVGSAGAALTAMQAALTVQGRTFLEVPATAFSAMPLADIQAHQAIVWLGYGLGPSSPANVATMQSYLDAGGRALVIYDDFGYNWRFTPAPNFLTTYFGASYVADSGSRGPLTGADIMAGVSTDATGDSLADSVILVGDAVGIFANTAPRTNWAGVRVERDNFKTVALFFNFNYAAPAASQTAIAQKTVDWLVKITTDAVPWASEDPTTGSLPANSGVQQVAVSFTAAVAAVKQPGTYHAALVVENDDTNRGEMTIPLTMIVDPAANAGKLSGIVRNLGACDANPAPLDQAKVFIHNDIGYSQTITTNLAGQYQYWLPAGGYTLTVSAVGNLTRSAKATVTAGATTTANVDLRWLQPCVRAEPHSLAATVSMGVSTTLPVTISNVGAANLTFQLQAADGGFDPMRPHAGDVDWLSFVPTAGTVVADGGTSEVNVTLDASVAAITQPGLYYGTLNVSSNDPAHPALAIPVTMTVNPLAEQGKLSGVVTGLGYCDNTPTSIKDAAVLIEAGNGVSWTLKTDAAGRYQMWLAETTAPMTISVAAPDHTTGTAAGVVVMGDQTTAQSFDLRWLKPCVNVQPASVAVPLKLGVLATVPLTLTNAGAVSTTFTLTWTSGAAPGAGTDWLTLVSPLTNTLAANQSLLPFAVTFDSSVVTRTGAYSGTLKVITDDPMHPTLAIPVTMTVGAAPHCSFLTSSPTLLGEATVITNTSTQATASRWNFGDGTPISDAVSPSHTYAAFGVYTVTLTTSNAWGDSACTGQVTVDALPRPSFTAHKVSPSSTTLVFANTTPGVLPSVTAWLWHFGDGETSTVKTPSHAYVNRGIYTVTLTATNARGSVAFTARVVAGLPNPLYLPIIRR